MSEQMERAIRILRAALAAGDIAGPPTTLYIVRRRSSRSGNDDIALVYATGARTIAPLTATASAAIGAVYDQTIDAIKLRHGMTGQRIIDSLSVAAFGEPGHIPFEWI